MGASSAHVSARSVVHLNCPDGSSGEDIHHPGCVQSRTRLDSTVFVRLDNTDNTHYTVRTYILDDTGKNYLKRHCFISNHQTHGRDVHELPRIYERTVVFFIDHQR